jgi:hypothetical protein
MPVLDVYCLPWCWVTEVPARYKKDIFRWISTKMFSGAGKNLARLYCFYPDYVLWCSSTTFSAQLTASLRDLARHFKTEPTETVSVGNDVHSALGTFIYKSRNLSFFSRSLPSSSCCVQQIFGCVYDINRNGHQKIINTRSPLSKPFMWSF